MLSVIVSVIFLGSMILQLRLGMRMFNLLSKLSDKGIKISRWSGYAAKRDLKRTLNSTNDKDIKEIIIKILNGIKERNRLFWGTFGTFILIVILNIIFKWKV